MNRSIRGMLVLVGAALTALSSFGGSAGAVTATITGPQETVYDYTTMRCDDIDVPDGHAQAFRDSLGRIQVIAPDGMGRRLIGPDFNHLTRDCTKRFAQVFDPNPAHYNWSRLMMSLYTSNGQDVYALVHNEFHGWEVPGACPTVVPKRRCGSGGITFAVSHDNGDSFVAPPAPDNFVATVPPRPTFDDPRTGLFSPSNPIKKGNYWYVVTLFGAVREQDPGVCVMRTADITDPHSWRGWDGTSFSVRFRNPYYENVTPQRTHLCEPASYENILVMSRSLTFNTVLNKYVLTGSAIKFDPVQSRNVYGFYFSTSDDLVHWSPRELLLEVPSLVNHTCGGPDVGVYPSLIDHDSTDRNFRITDDTVYLYYTLMHYNAACMLTLDRDLVRVPVQFSP
jgi:hypothetical protein